jgi:2,4-dienoyl-CoA reductase-like NADH-dependent reductase (Old Yellow Enzyme family)
VTSSPLTTPLTLRSGVVLPQPIAMAPMVAQGSSPADGSVTAEDIAYAARRSRVAGMLITGAAYVARDGRGFERQMSIAADQDVEGLATLARAMKQDGAKAFVQLYHGGREAYPAAAETGRALAPSTQSFDWLPYVPQEMTEEEIVATIAAFGAATRRAIDAGFDGVEVHGANHYLLQQFFSRLSNHREDAWGGDLERRTAFPLAVLDEVLRVAAEADRPFAVGYRICPDEIHGEDVGYTVDEARELIDRVVARGVDYLHVSIFTGYDAAPAGTDRSYGQVVQDTVAGRCPVVIVSDVFTEQDAERALAHGDIVAIGRAALVEPEFAGKIADGHGDRIEVSVKGRLQDLALPAGLVEWYRGSGRAALPPLPGFDEYLG